MVNAFHLHMPHMLVWRLLQQALLTGNDLTAHKPLRCHLEVALDQVDAENRAKLQMLLRLSHAAEQFPGSGPLPRTGVADLLVLMRQIIRTFGSKLDIPSAWWKRLQTDAAKAGIHPDPVTGQRDDVLSLYATAWQPAWLPDFDTERAESLAYRRTQQAALGDGMLTKYSGGRLTTYRSEGQKAALDAVLHSPPGVSLLVTLPTGGGKSMCVLLPAWLASNGGQSIGGTTIVVVPTVSLAIDQHAHVSDSFATYRPATLLGDTEGELRSEIYQGICEGTLPILYTSPESLINNRRLRESILTAAGRGFLNWLVIDEAHMVEQWGAGFRTEFQLLAALRLQLLEQSKGQMRTLLLSATISEACKETLTDLFGDGRELAIVAANQLRPEIAYWMSLSETQEERKQRVIDALWHLPRPAILYVTLPEEADGWVKELRERRFGRIAAYTGKTSSAKRGEIMQAWARNEIDLIVATSAFGLGVDKEDVRAVIHATLPENIDRFYQEVGRGGRDGCQSISLLCTVLHEDEELAKSMSIRSRITTDKAWSRWSGMWLKRRHVEGSENHFLLDLEASPINRPEMEASDRHRNWNEHILLLMQRADLIRICDSNPSINESDNEEAASQSSLQPYREPPVRRWLHIELLNSTITYSEADFTTHFERPRYEELNEIMARQEQMKKLAEVYGRYKSSQAKVPCISNKFREVYRDAAVACGGCPVCRSHNYSPLARPVHLESDLAGYGCLDAPVELRPNVHELFCAQPHVLLAWEEGEYPQRRLAQLLPRLLQAGFSQFVLPHSLLESKEWTCPLLKSFAHLPLMPRHRLLSDEMALGKTDGYWSLYPWPTVVVYPTEPAAADLIFRQVNGLGTKIALVQILQRQLALPSHYGRFLEKVNGRHLGIQEFSQELQERLETL